MSERHGGPKIDGVVAGRPHSMTAKTPTLADVLSEFRSAMREAGVPTSDDICADGQLQRFHVEGDKPGSRNGWYVLHTDDPPAGACGSWRTGVSQTWCLQAGGAMSAAEHEQFRRKSERTKLLLRKQEQQRHTEARERAAYVWGNASPAASEHPYLQAKSIQVHGIRQDRGQLLIPVYGADSILRGLQYISEDGDKLFQTGTEVKGGYYPIGEPSGTLIICEGYATGATIHEATRHAVAVAFNCCNLKPVAQALQRKLGGAIQIIIAADDDQDTKGNPGVASATGAAQTIKGLLAVPTFAAGETGSDFNDLANLRGLEAVVADIEAAASLESVVAPITSQPTRDRVPEWPEPLEPEALYGLAGEFVRTVEPHSEADPAALLTGLLAMAGNAIGCGPHLRVEADEHPGRLFVVWVGATAGGRKGTAQGRTSSAVVLADEAWAQRVQSGLSSGEGLIHAVRDPVIGGERDKLEVSDPGVIDKRLMVVEAEFASTLRILRREGNTLSPTLRNAWDSGDLQTLTKGSPTRATGAHISVIGHITAAELRHYLTATEAGNGFANRFLWICVRRSKALPFGGDLDPQGLENVTRQLRAAIEWASSTTVLTWAAETRQIWANVYPSLSEGRPGLLGAVTSRAEAQTVRLATLYAALDCSSQIMPEHLHAALAVWDYALASAKCIFGEDLGNPLADQILSALHGCPDGMTRTGLRNHFDRHKSSAEIGAALKLLSEKGLVEKSKVGTNGRPAECWRLVRSITAHKALTAHMAQTRNTRQ